MTVGSILTYMFYNFPSFWLYMMEVTLDRPYILPVFAHIQFFNVYVQFHEIVSHVENCITTDMIKTQKFPATTKELHCAAIFLLPPPFISPGTH